MKTLRLFLTDLRKQRLSVAWLLVLVLPLGANAAMLLDMSLRYRDYLYPRSLERGLTSWQTLLIEHHHILMWGTFLPFFVALISAAVYATEFRHQGWKQLLSLPVPWLGVYLSKTATILFFTLCLVLLDSAGLVVVGLLFRFPEPLQPGLFARYAGGQIIAVLAVTALHNWLSSYSKNPLVPVGVGLGAVMLSYTLYYSYPSLAGWFFYTYTIYAGDMRHTPPASIFIASLGLSLLFGAAGWLEFRKRDIGGNGQ